MKRTNKRWLASPLLLLLSILLVISLTSCSTAGSKTVYSKEELAENVTRGATDCDSVAEFLDEWDFPRFSERKVNQAESILQKRYYLELPTTEELAEMTARGFLENYYDKIDLTSEDAVTDALIYSYVDSIGDVYTVYRTAEEYESYSSGLSGSFVGIGVTVTYNADTAEMTVIEVMEGGGAEAAGVLVGDVIIAVDGERVADLGYENAVNAVRGESGTDVVLTVKRGDGEVHITATRKAIEEKTVKYSLTDGIGYIKISAFKRNTYGQFVEAVDYMERNNARGVVYDLRNNGGGYLSSVVNVLSYIAPEGTTISTFSNNYGDDAVATGEHTFLIPSVVLCNGGTASAGELFTSAIRDFGEMRLMESAVVGENTFGKGIMQSTFSLFDGSSITLTVAYYTSPLGENYHGVGIEPSLTVAPAADGDNQLSSAYETVEKLID